MTCPCALQCHILDIGHHGGPLNNVKFGQIHTNSFGVMLVGHIKNHFPFLFFSQTLGVTSKPHEKRMSAERCARLMAISIANKRQEVWITRNPELVFLYMFQYLPALALR